MPASPICRSLRRLFVLLMAPFSRWFAPALLQIARQLVPRRVPLVRQLSALECGAACLAMILGYHGRPTRVDECREPLGVGRDGVTARAIASAARHFGLRVKAFSLDIGDFKHVQLPAIAHWNFNHFVVVERWSPQRVTIVDPAAGRRSLTPAEFDAAFTGVVLTFEPGVQFAHQRAKGHSPWWIYFQAVLRVPGVLLQLLLASLLLQGLGLILPTFTVVFVDQVVPGQIREVMPILALGMVLLVLANVAMSYLRAALLINLQARLDSQLMLGFFEHLLALPFRFFEQRPSGDLLLRLSSNTTIRDMLTNQSLALVLDGGLVLVYLFILLTQAPTLALLALAIGLVHVAITVGTTRRLHELAQQDLAAQSDGQSYLVEALGGITTLKAAGAEDRAFDHWSNLFFKQLNVALQRNQFSSLLEAVLGGLRTLTPLLLLWVGVQQVLDGTLSLGLMLGLNTLAMLFLTPLATLVSNIQRFQLVGVHLERLADVLEAELEQDSAELITAPRLSGRIEVKNLSFRYATNAPLVLRNISFRLAPGQSVALVGRTGSGKSTLARLLLGLYQPSEGALLYDDIPLQQLNYRSLRSQFGVVLQDMRLFRGSIRENIAFNDPTMPFERVLIAAQLAAVHEDIVAMPMSYETIVAEDGGTLSGGQRQRIMLARALAHRPAVLLLDEATSHLDAVTEQKISAALERLQITRILVAHRLSTVRNADLILVLDQGTIVEQGTHAELLALNGLYAELVQRQATTEVAAPSTDVAF